MSTTQACICYLGEFAYEVMYAGIARRHGPEYGHLVVATRPDRMAFHLDYASEVIPHSLKCVGMNCTATPETMPSKEAVAACAPAGHAIIRPIDYGWNYLRHGEYIVYGQTVPALEGSIVLHARNRVEYCQERDWTPDNWHRLAGLLAREFPDNRLVCIGSPTAAHAVEGAVDLRGIPLDKLFNVLHSANVFIGQSSGPAHLASHCGCPHIIWCEPGIDGLYQRHWNPHRTWVRTRVFAGDPHKPSYDMVREYVMASLGELRKAAV